MDAKIFNFAEEKQKKQQAAYEWAVSEQARMACMAEPLNLEFSGDNMTEDSPECIISIFRDEATGRTLLRRDWFELMGVKYNLLANFEEVQREAPNSIQHMLDNGLRLYDYYDGACGGVTRRTDRPWRPESIAK